MVNVDLSLEAAMAKSRNNEENGAAIWKWTTAGLSAALVSGVAFWFILGSNAITREEMRRETESLRQGDARIQEKLENISNRQTEIGTKLQDAVDEIKVIRRRLDRLEKKNE